MAEPEKPLTGYFDGMERAISASLPSSFSSENPNVSPERPLSADPPTLSRTSSQTVSSPPEVLMDIYSSKVNGQPEGDVLTPLTNIPSDDEVMSIKSRMKAADKHATQYAQYIKLLEDRMSSIEEKIQIFFKEPGPLEPQPKPMTSPAHLILDSAQLRWNDFKYSSRNGKFAIDILEGDPDLEHLSMPKRGGPHFSSKDYEYFASRPYQPYEVRSLFPERIRINSTIVTNILRKVTSLTIPHPPVILRPFKMLVHFEKQIRGYWRDLEEEWEGHMPPYADKACFKTTTPRAGQGNTSSGSEREVGGQSDIRQKRSIEPDNEEDTDRADIDSKAALRRLRILIGFMDEYVKQPAERLTSEKCPHIFFADLWHLFKPGEEVYCPPGDNPNGTHAFGLSQAYRILQTTGGRRYLVGKPMSKDTEDDLTLHHEKYSPLVVSCVYFDFDGKKFGPIKHTFSIREYKGKMPVRALPVYPLRFAENPEQLRQTLQDRGDSFIKLARVSHNHYEGLTLEPKEEIDSQVIIDFEVTLQNRPEWRPDFNMDYPAASDPRETTESASNGCADLNCCRNDYIFKDEALDSRLMSEFVESYPLLSDKARLWGLSDLGADDKRLLPGRVFAFVLRNRSWAALDINSVKKIPEKPDGFDQLVLKRGHKDLVKALVKTHSCGSRPAAFGAGAEHQVDLVKGKGKGLIILLHGAPGVGKTSTAGNSHKESS
ncbi:hypothetical protein GP486_000593 [Trichoglossum hirsutum]|uniref:DUF7025 domain-containing protein n=1 Tax=Trichoglossum hirsutum TaxID=265104 RepID=A0A9P8LI92_9PEZI|nr:hypothetical protein GP486_000593 [Trichoglossum hirsutum]